MIAECFPELAPRRLEEFGEGWDNTAFLVDGEWVFRFPRRAVAGELMEVECTVLPAIAPYLPLPVPVPKWIGRSEAHLPWTFAGYRLLAGRTACRATPNAAQRCAAAEALAQFLAALHTVPTDELRARGATGDLFGRLDLQRRLPKAEEQIEEALRIGLISKRGPWMAAIEGLPSGWEPGGSTLVHGDLYARHVLLDDGARPCGVIDWGDAHLGDPAIDLALAWGFLPPAGRRAFRAAYGSIDEDTWRVARFRALSSAFAILLYGHDVGDGDLLREGRTALEHIGG